MAGINTSRRNSTTQPTTIKQTIGKPLAVSKGDADRMDQSKSTNQMNQDNDGGNK